MVAVGQTAGRVSNCAFCSEKHSLRFISLLYPSTSMVRQAVFLVDLNYVPDALVSLRDVPFNTVIHAFYSSDIIPSLLDYSHLPESDSRRIHLHRVLYSDLYVSMSFHAGILHATLPPGTLNSAADVLTGAHCDDRFRFCRRCSNESSADRAEVAVRCRSASARLYQYDSANCHAKVAA